jgi:hypothetical protein
MIKLLSLLLKFCFQFQLAPLQRGSAAAAHAAYVLAGATPQPFHPSTRVCLVGADHRRRPRTYPTPAAIQRTELLEHALSLANPQSVLAPFQPYKLHYAVGSGKCCSPRRQHTFEPSFLETHGIL